MLSSEPGDLKTQYEEFLARARERATYVHTVQPVAPWVQNRLLGITNDHEAGNKSWVRIRRMKGHLKTYVGDLALAISTSQPETYEFWMIPRPRLTKEPKNIRPMQMLLDPGLAITEYGPESVSYDIGHKDRFCFLGRDYSRRGFLVMRGPRTMAVSFQEQVLPTTRELDQFTSCEAMDDYFCASTKDRMAQNDIVAGDRVKGIAGTLQGLTGIVQDVSEDTATIHIPCLDLLETVMRFEVRKRFLVGDKVVVSDTAEQAGRYGWIVSIQEKSVVVLDHHQFSEVSSTVYLYGIVIDNSQNVVYMFITGTSL